MSRTERKTFSIDGMHCEHCVRAVRSALDELDGLSVDDVEIGSVHVSYETETVSEGDIAAAIQDAGYEIGS